MSLWTAAEIAEATGGTASEDFSVDAVTFDSREVIGGELFVAMKGETTDGHRYIESAHERGAAGFLASEACAYPNVRVGDGFAGLEALGRASRARSSAKIIGVTGSVGKTSVKEALRFALSEVEPERTHWSVKSYNNHTGVPLSLARMPRDARYGILEMGMNHPGELAALTHIVRPHIAIVTWVTSAHLAFFDSEAAIADAKAEIFEGLEPGGIAVIPHDSEHRDRLIEAARLHADRVLTFGRKASADVHLIAATEEETGSTVIADVAGNRCAYRVSMPGAHWVQNSLCVMAAAHAAGADLAAAGLGLSQIRGMAGRGERHCIAANGGKALLIDESYNANPASMAAALALLGSIKATGRKIAILGAMRELGHESDRLHAELAGSVEASGAGLAILVGDEMAPLAAKLGSKLRVISVSDSKGAEAALNDVIAAGDAILLKGSNSIGLGRLVTALRGRTG